MKKITLGISGMSCSACSNGLEKHLNKKEGVILAEVNLVMANATVTFDETILSQKDIEQFVKEAGFKSTGLYDLSKMDDSNKPIYPLIIFGVLTLLLMYVAMGHMFGLYIPDIISPSKNPLWYAIALIVLVIPFFVYGYDIFVNGIKSLIHLAPNMDTLVSMGVVASFAFSLFYTVLIGLGNHHYAHELYFESCATVIYFIKLGRYLDSLGKSKTKQAIRDLVKITPDDAVILKDGVLTRVTIDQIIKNDIVVTKAGEKFAVDGTIVSGTAHVDESFITGESKPVLKKVGDTVVAGSINHDGYIEYSAEKIGRDSTVSEIVKMVIEASNTKMPIAKTVDKVCLIFVPAIIILALLSFVGYWAFGAGFSVAIKTFVTVLVVACPCALGLATPLAVVVGEGLCAKKGILVKDSKVLEIANKATVVVFDKTGTLTYGDQQIAVINNYSSLSDNEILTIASSIESKSSHPIATAFSKQLKERRLAVIDATAITTVAGRGISGIINGNKYFVGSAKFMAEENIFNDKQLDEEELSSHGNTIVYLADSEKVLAIFGVNDTIRAGAYNLVLDLKNSGVKTVMLSGDNEKVAKLVADKLGIDEYHAGVSPKDKSQFIKELKAKGEIVVMFGDGINDSPALTVADVGISVKSGTDIAMDSASVILLGEEVDKISDFLTISKKTIKCIKQNLFWAFLYNSLMVPIAMGALSFVGFTINPMLASIAMVLSSICVILNTLRLRLIK